MGYANNKYDLNKNDSNNFLLRTGDIGYRDKDDFFFIVGKPVFILEVMSTTMRT